MDEKNRILLICAHPDDEAIAVGGTIAKFATGGAEITTLVFATGNEGFAKLEEKEAIVNQRIQEREEAGKILGITRYEIHNYPDYGIPADETVYKLCISAIRKYKPHIILTHYWREYMAHKNVATVATEAWWQAGWNCSVDLGEPWKCPVLYYFEVIEPLPEVSHIVDISDFWKKKITALECYKSQHSVVANLLQQVEGLAKFRGSAVGVKYGEALLRANFVKKHVNSLGELT